jgi:iron complex outermembrane receptor protein
MRRRAPPLAGHLVLGAIALWGLTAGAQESREPGRITDLDDLSLQALLNQTVTTASGGTGEARSLASANVYSVSREEIARQGWRSLAQILEAVPGLYVVDDLAVPSVGVRGTTGGLRSGTRIVKIMIDGQAVNFRPDLTALIGPEFIPLEAIERIEVARGPLSALYGANAFLATVNVITRTPGTGVKAEVAARANVVRDRGGYGGSGLVSLAGSAGNLLVAFSADRIDRSGLAVAQTYSKQRIPPGLDEQSSTDDLARPMTAFVRVGRESPRLGSLSLEAGMQRLDSVGEFQLNAVQSDSRVALLNLWSTARYERSFADRGSVGASVGYSRGSPESAHRLQLTQNPAYTFAPHLGYQALEGHLDGTLALPAGTRLKVGLDAEHTDEQVLYYTQIFNRAEGTRQPGDEVPLIQPDEPRHESFLDLGAYAQATGSPLARLPGLYLTGNVRADRITFGPVHYPLQYSWRAAIAYRWSDALVTKLIAGRAFQTPSGVLLFGHPGFGNVNNVIGSALLAGAIPVRPQNVNSVEAVASGTLGEHLSLELSVYFQSIGNRIEFIQSGAYFVAANQGTRDTIGSEGTLRARLGGGLSGFLSATVVRGYHNGPTDSDAIELYPRQFGRLGLNLELPRAFINLNGQLRAVAARGASQSNIYYNDKTPYALPAYAMVDLTVTSLAVELRRMRLPTILLGVRNLLDARAAEPGFAGFDVPGLGRAITVELRQPF